MATRDQKPISLTKFRGIYDREETDQVPLDHLKTAHNVVCGQRGFNGRESYTILFEPSTTVNSNFSHLRTFQQVNATPSFTLLDATNHYWRNSLEGLDRAAPATATKLAAVTMFNRQYLCFSDGQTGLTGEYVKIYSPGTSWIYRQAAGVPPTSACTGATGGAGNVEIGTHLFTVVYETDTGFITPPNTAYFVAVVCPGATVVNLANIPVGPTGTAKRRILMSKRIPNYTGNPLDYRMYFVPSGNGGVIADNVTTTTVISLYDSSLVSSADYLLDLMTAIPAGVCLGEMNGRMLVMAPYGSGWICYASRFNDPESFSTVDGFILAKPGEGGNIKTYLVDNSILYLFKDNRTVAIQDNGLEPAYWKCSNVDGTLGTCLDGLSSSNFNGNSNTPGATLVANNGGLYQFSGGFNPVPLSWKIERLWVSKFNVNTSVVIDTVRKRIYVLFPGADAPTTTFLVADFSEGLDPQSIKWHTWGFDTVAGDNPRQLFIYSDSTYIINNPGFLYFSQPAVKSILYYIDKFTTSPNITALIETADLAFSQNEDEICHVQEIRLYGRYSGLGAAPNTGQRTIAIAVKDSDLAANSESKNFIVSSTTPSVWTVPASYLQLKNPFRFYLSISWTSPKIYVGKIVIYGKEVYTSKPQ